MALGQIWLAACYCKYSFTGIYPCPIVHTASIAVLTHDNSGEELLLRL